MSRCKKGTTRWVYAVPANPTPRKKRGPVGLETTWYETRFHRKSIHSFMWTCATCQRLVTQPYLPLHARGHRERLQACKYIAKRNDVKETTVKISESLEQQARAIREALK